MFHLLINFCIITFVCYAAAFPVRAILFGSKKRGKRSARRTAQAQTARRVQAAAKKRQAKIIVLRHYRKKSRKEAQPLRMAG